MKPSLVLASQSSARQQMLTQARVPFQAVPARLDEEAILASLQAEGASPRDIADTLAELKAEKAARKHPEAVVIGSDQVLAFDGQLLAKPATPDMARAQLAQMSGHTHRLISAVVVYHDARPVWRSIGLAKLSMRSLSNDFIADYVARNWDHIQHCVGGYQIEAEGIRLFHQIEGDYHAILGMPLLPLLTYLAQRNWIDG